MVVRHLICVEERPKPVAAAKSPAEGK